MSRAVLAHRLCCWVFTRGVTAVRSLGDTFSPILLPRPARWPRSAPAGFARPPQRDSTAVRVSLSVGPSLVLGLPLTEVSVGFPLSCSFRSPRAVLTGVVAAKKEDFLIFLFSHGHHAEDFPPGGWRECAEVARPGEQLVLGALCLPCPGTVWQDDSSLLSQPRLPEPSLSLVTSVLMVLETVRAWRVRSLSPPAPRQAASLLGPGDIWELWSPPHECRICSLGPHCKAAQRWELLLETHVPTRRGLWQADPCPPTCPPDLWTQA